MHHYACCWFAADLLHFVCIPTPMTTHFFTRAVGRVDGCFRGWAPWCGQFPCRPGCQYERKDEGETNARIRFDHITYIQMTMRNSSSPLRLIMKFHVISVSLLKDAQMDPAESYVAEAAPELVVCISHLCISLHGTTEPCGANLSKYSATRVDRD